MIRFVDANILELLTSYSMGDLDLESLEDLVIPLAWDEEGSAQDLVDRVSAEIAMVKDGASDEAMFRELVGEIVASPVTPARNE